MGDDLTARGASLLSSGPAWADLDPASIPTKADLSWILDGLPAPPGRVLDLGCGAGALAAQLEARGHDVTGLDVNAQAIEVARQRAPRGEFFVGDALALPELGAFDAVVAQLVVSIIGDAAARRRLVQSAASALRPGGLLFVSASGVSDDINPEYARLYKEDLALTGEPYTYLSRAADGVVLYRTHHLHPDELEGLLTGAGLALRALTRKREVSSRRPGEAAWFLYAVAARPLSG